VPDEPTANELLAVTISRLDDVRVDIRDLRNEVRESRNTMVSRAEWEMRNRAVDQRFEGQGREIAELKAARAPWWSWATVLIAAAGFAWALLGPVLSAGG